MVLIGDGAASAIDSAKFGAFQFRIAALCALVAGLDGFDTQAIAYLAPSIGEAWGSTRRRSVPFSVLAC